MARVGRSPNNGVSFDEVVEILVRFVDPKTIYNEILKLVKKRFNADCCQIIVKDWERDIAKVRAISSELDESDRGFSTTILNQVIDKKEPICIGNAIDLPDLKERPSISGKIFLSVIAVPIFDEDNEPIGAFYLDRRDPNKGEYDKTCDLDQLQDLMMKLTPGILAQQESERIQKLKEDSTKREIRKLGVIVGVSEKMDEVYPKIKKYAQNDSTVYIHGESGVGKEWVAEALHRLDERKNKRTGRFVIVDCTRFSKKEDAEIELFGIVKNVFTGVGDKAGQFELANNGTIFLDEFGELPMEVTTW